MSHLAADLSGLVEDELRAFNVERIYATDKTSTAASIVEAARQLPMMAARRVVVVLRAEKLLKPRRKGKTDEEPEPDDAGSAPDLDALETYVKSPEPQTVLIFLASDVDRSRRLYKALQKQATIVECWGLKASKDARVDLRQVARQAEQLVRQCGDRRRAADRSGGSRASLPSGRARTSRGFVATSSACCCTRRGSRALRSPMPARSSAPRARRTIGRSPTRFPVETRPRRYDNSGCRLIPARFRL